MQWSRNANQIILFESNQNDFDGCSLPFDVDDNVKEFVEQCIMLAVQYVNIHEFFTQSSHNLCDIKFWLTYCVFLRIWKFPFVEQNLLKV